MKRFAILAPLFLGLALAADTPSLSAQPPRYWRDRDYRAYRVPDIGGQWFMWGDEDKPCFIRQRAGSRHALFINEHGSRAWGTIRGNRVFIPDWGDNGMGQRGIIRGDRITWLPDRSYWSR
jgi:hypothetical protein